MRRGDVVYYLHADHLGSVSVVSDGSGALLASQQYLPYGETRHATGVPPTDFGFTGQRNEGTIGLYDYRARFYSPLLGCFISADSIVPNPGNPQDLNRYAYVRNNPLRYTDPSGHAVDWGDDLGGPWPPPLPPQPPVTTWDTPLSFWIEPGGFYGEGSVYWEVGEHTVGPVSVYVPPANSQRFDWPDYSFQEEGWRQRGSSYIGISDVTKEDRWSQFANVLASYAAARLEEIPDPPAIVPERINVDPKYIGQDRAIYVPGQYDTGGLGSGTAVEGAMNLPGALSPGENISLRYVSITVQQRGCLLRALVVAEYPREAYISYGEGPWYRETPVIRPSDIETIGMNWSGTSLGQRR